MTERSSGDVTVAALLREPLEITLAFVAWYLDLGAARIVLYLDDPQDPAIAVLAGHPQVACIPGTPELWSALKVKDPGGRHVFRQIAALTHAYRTATTPWILCVDGDEYVHIRDGRSLRDIAAGAPRRARALRFPVAEEVQVARGDGRSRFRLTMKPWTMLLAYGRDAALFRDHKGLAGHCVGKSMTRTGLPIRRAHAHWYIDPDGKRIDGRWIPPRTAVLLHYYDRGYESWRSKIVYRSDSKSVTPPVSRLVKGNRKGEAGFRAIYRRLHHMGPLRHALIERLGAGLSLEVDPVAGAGDRFSGARP